MITDNIYGRNFNFYAIFVHKKITFEATTRSTTFHVCLCAIFIRSIASYVLKLCTFTKHKLVDVREFSKCHKKYRYLDN